MEDELTHRTLNFCGQLRDTKYDHKNFTEIRELNMRNLKKIIVDYKRTKHLYTFTNSCVGKFQPAKGR